MRLIYAVLTLLFLATTVQADTPTDVTRGAYILWSPAHMSATGVEFDRLVTWKLPTVDDEHNPLDKSTLEQCGVSIRSEYPRSRTREDECREGWGYDPDTDERYCLDRNGSSVSGWHGAEWIDARPGSSVNQIGQVVVNLTGLSGFTKVDLWCETTQGRGLEFTSTVELNGPTIPTEPSPIRCTHPVQHNGQTVCQPD